MCGQRYTAAGLPRERALVINVQEDWWASETVWTGVEKEIYLFLLGFKPVAAQSYRLPRPGPTRDEFNKLRPLSAT